MGKHSKMNKSSSPNKKKTIEKKKSRQGKLNMSDPFSKVIKYDTESSSESEASAKEEIISSNSDNEETMHLEKKIDNPLSKDSKLGKNGQNILSAALRNRNVLEYQDFLQVIVWKQKGGSKLLKGKDLKKFQKEKTQMMCISKLCLAGSHLEHMKPFLDSSFQHLNQNADYIEMSSDIIEYICYLLKNVAVMNNVDSGAMADYFHRRFADLRNRKNYTAK